MYWQLGRAHYELPLQSLQQSWLFYLKTRDLTLTYLGTTPLHLQKGSSLLCLSLLLLLCNESLKKTASCLCEFSFLDWYICRWLAALMETGVLRSLLALTLPIGFDLNRVRWDYVGLISTPVLKHVFSFHSFNISQSHLPKCLAIPSQHDTLVGGSVCPINMLFLATVIFLSFR